jgi:hypothetical protein
VRSTRIANYLSNGNIAESSVAGDMAVGRAAWLSMRKDPRHPKETEQAWRLTTKIVPSAKVPSGLDVHLILDNYGTHKTAIIRNWLAKRPRFHVHFTPTYGSWINLVERWFAELTNKRIRRGSFARSRN